MKKITVEDNEAGRARLKELYDDSALTLEGLSPDDANLGEFADWLKAIAPFKGEETFYIIGGDVMNKTYGLTGDNAYPASDCTIVCAKLSDLKEPMKLAIPRFQIGARWFDDVVDNNVRREAETQEGAE